MWINRLFMASRKLFSDGGFSLAIDWTEDIHTLPFTLPLPPNTLDTSKRLLDTSDAADTAELMLQNSQTYHFFVSLVDQIKLLSSVDKLQYVNDGTDFIHLLILCSLSHIISRIIVTYCSTIILRYWSNEKIHNGRVRWIDGTMRKFDVTLSLIYTVYFQFHCGCSYFLFLAVLHSFRLATSSHDKSTR